MDFMPIPLGKNKFFPKWMDFNCHDRVMEIFGCVPDSSKHVFKKEMLVRINDVDDFICREFNVVVKKKQEERYNLVGYQNDWIRDEENEEDEIYDGVNSSTYDVGYNLTGIRKISNVKKKSLYSLL